MAHAERPAFHSQTKSAGAASKPRIEAPEGRTDLSSRPYARWARGFLRRARPYWPALSGSAFVGWLATRAILESAGRPAAPLDDSFIHLQYARRLAEGGLYSYVAGEGATTGATSLLWPLLLSPWYALGARGLSLIWITWVFGWLAHAGVAVETARIAQRLAGRAGGIAAGAMCIAFGAFAWFAWSGMETVPLAWILMRVARRAAERCDGPALSNGIATPEEAAADRRTAIELAVLGAAAPLLRPEGAIASVMAALALALRPAPMLRRGPLARLLCLAPLIGPAIQPLANLVLVGHAASSTTTVKWLVGNPYYGGGRLAAATLANVRLLFDNLLNGTEWTAVFVPEYMMAVPLAFGALALPLLAWRGGARWHGVFVAMVALGTLVPCTYLSFLWNRVRYIWPFAGAWFVLLACFARATGDLARRARAGLGHVGPLIGGLFVGVLATKLPWTVRDLAQSARAIDRQQVLLGEWAAEHLEPGARIGVNDTGAIAYMSGHKTFDVVGLTTEGEAEHWVAGPGSRFEHYERLPRERLPTHFIVYPHWMACPPVLGRQLTEATVVEQSILGGNTMVAYEARWDLLGSGEHPSAPVPGTLVDELDVADLVSEATHGYELLEAWDNENQAMLAPAPATDSGEIRSIADGARSNRRLDRFEMRRPARARLVVRLAIDEPLAMAVRIDGSEVAALDLPAGAWVERQVELPAGSTDRARFELVAQDGKTFSSAHYWMYESPP